MTPRNTRTRAASAPPQGADSEAPAVDVDALVAACRLVARGRRPASSVYAPVSAPAGGGWGGGGRPGAGVAGCGRGAAFGGEDRR